MCIQFTCNACQCTFADHCKDKPIEAKPIDDDDFTTIKPANPSTEASRALAATLPNQKEVCKGLTLLNEPKKCETCVRIRGATSALQSLVYRFPFLSTDGIAGIENLAVWERQSVKKALCERVKAWDDKAESRDERHKVQEKIASMGLEEVEDRRLEHQGFAMAVTPGKDDKKMEKVVEVWE